LNKLFVYGIFLAQHNRDWAGMTNPKYATVKDYVTQGWDIVTARKLKGANLSLTGLLVDVDPSKWKEIDALERGYDRIEIRTTGGDKAYMYAGKEIK